ncbi:hypothetical protein WJX84_004622 [Apatococcus fuscideae]|uniref:Uncharacterized protein n=1 Tax=Apatococcus fuscideae TaxID=2026836 RepID=A0AAW1SQT5_9CHLO
MSDVLTTDIGTGPRSVSASTAVYRILDVVRRSCRKARGRHHLGAAAAEDVGPNAGQGVAVARRALQALGDSDIPDEPSHAEDWEVAVKALSLARQAAGQAAKAAQLIGRGGQQEAAEAAEALGTETSEQAREALYAGFGAVARAVSGAGEQAKIAGHMAGANAYYLAATAATLSDMYYGQAAAAVGALMPQPADELEGSLGAS